MNLDKYKSKDIEVKVVIDNTLFNCSILIMDKDSEYTKEDNEYYHYTYCEIVKDTYEDALKELEDWLTLSSELYYDEDWRNKL